jgi:hypothetical protein
MCPPTPCKGLLAPKFSQQPISADTCVKSKTNFLAADQVSLESSASSSSPGTLTPELCLPPAAPEVPKLRPSVPRSFARECSSYSGSGTTTTDNSEPSPSESPLSVHCSPTVLDHNGEVKPPVAEKDAGRVPAALPAFVDGLAALQQYTSSIDESLSSSPSHVSSDASTYIPHSTPSSRNTETATPKSECQMSLLDCQISDISKLSFKDSLQKIPQPYCPPHKRHPRTLVSANQETFMDKESTESHNSTRKLPPKDSIKSFRRAAEKGPFLCKLLTPFPTTLPGTHRCLSIDGDIQRMLGQSWSNVNVRN